MEQVTNELTLFWPEHLTLSGVRDAYNKIDFHQTCDKMPKVDMHMINKTL